MTNRSDQHDLDKLDRWQEALTEPRSHSFPVYAVFLVSEADQAAHDIFRAFRNSFEQRGAGFGNLVIFGQHGVSSMVHAMLSRLTLTQDSIPLLALLTSPDDSLVYILPLPPGDASDPNTGKLSDTSLGLLSRVERFADQADKAFDDSELTELRRIPLLEPGLMRLVSHLVGQINEETK
tara:strand:- start:127 stop:663 length:537 start_codon:yes stop_codon:yes gene_type:complete